MRPPQPPVHIHTTSGGGGYFDIAGDNPFLLEPLFNDPRLRKTNFVLLHGGWPFVHEIGSLLQKPNVYLDLSQQSLMISPRTMSTWLREWLELFPEKILYATDAYPYSQSMGWEEAAYIANQNIRTSLGMAFTGMMNDKQITKPQAEKLAHHGPPHQRRDPLQVLTQFAQNIVARRNPSSSPHPLQCYSFFKSHHPAFTGQGKSMTSPCCAALLIGLALCSLPSLAQEKPVANDIPSTFTPPAPPHPITAKPDFDYVKRVVMVPMRDGVKLYTVIGIPKGANDAPIILTRTPYNAAKPRADAHSKSRTCSTTCRSGRRIFVKAGYIRVFQDVRGKYGSEGAYVMTRRP